MLASIPIEKRNWKLERNKSWQYKSRLAGLHRGKERPAIRKANGRHLERHSDEFPTHPHGIKVRLESGEIGRVKEIVAS
jgi:hypothetical protein